MTAWRRLEGKAVCSFCLSGGLISTCWTIGSHWLTSWSYFMPGKLDCFWGFIYEREVSARLSLPEICSWSDQSTLRESESESLKKQRNSNLQLAGLVINSREINAMLIITTKDNSNRWTDLRKHRSAREAANTSQTEHVELRNIYPNPNISSKTTVDTQKLVEMSPGIRTLDQLNRPHWVLPATLLFYYFYTYLVDLHICTLFICSCPTVCCNCCTIMSLGINKRKKYLISTRVSYLKQRACQSSSLKGNTPQSVGLLGRMKRTSVPPEDDV